MWNRRGKRESSDRTVQHILDEIEKRIKGKRKKIKLILAVFLAKGHILLEDRPGVGKTTLGKTFAEVLNLEFKRIQFTADLLPSDIVGVNYFDIQAQKFQFKRGPIFTEILLADEINRASPKTQSGVLEAMEERQVTIDGETYKLSPHFFVIATQNPLEDSGTFPLPFSQLDRFLAVTSIGYPDPEAERKILTRQMLPPVVPIQPEEVDRLKNLVEQVHVEPPIINLILKIAQFTRGEQFKVGLSTRGALAILELAKSWAFVSGRDFVIDADVIDLLDVTLLHRVLPKNRELDYLSILREELTKLN
ncbi:MAG: AAA family ATPase [Campylobacterales bacterium]